jgi:hypothetical protein
VHDCRSSCRAHPRRTRADAACSWVPPIGRRRCNVHVPAPPRPRGHGIERRPLWRPAAAQRGRSGSGSSTNQPRCTTAHRPTQIASAASSVSEVGRAQPDQPITRRASSSAARFAASLLRRSRALNSAGRHRSCRDELQLDPLTLQRPRPDLPQPRVPLRHRRHHAGPLLKQAHDAELEPGAVREARRPVPDQPPLLIEPRQSAA